MIASAKDRAPLGLAALGLALLALALPSAAHVKWFADYAAHPRPVALSQLFSATGLALLLAAFGVTYCAYLLGRGLHRLPLAKWPTDSESMLRFSEWLIRAALVAAVLLCRDHRVILTPELDYNGPLLSAVQLLVVVGAAIDRPGWILPLGIVALFAAGCVQYDLVHMLDYTVFLGAAFFVYAARRHAWGKPWLAYGVLYGATGFSLCWAGIEKLVYPHWAAQVLAQEPALALGFPHELVVPAAAIVEFSVGFFFATQTLPRLCAAVLTVLMVLTSLLFGETELVGHLLFHAVLLTFIVVGRQRPPLLRGHPALRAARFTGAYALALIGLTACYYLFATAPAAPLPAPA